MYRYETESRIVTVLNETTPVVVNITLSPAKSLYESQSQSVIPVQESEQDMVITVKKPAPETGHVASYTSIVDFDSQFSDLERSLSSLIELVHYGGETGNREEKITVLKISKEVGRMFGEGREVEFF